MTPAGWIFLTFFWSTVIGINIFCFRKIMKYRHKHGQES